MAKVQDGKKDQRVAPSTLHSRFTMKVWAVFFASQFALSWLRTNYQVPDGQIAIVLLGILFLLGAELFYRLRGRIEQLEDQLKETSESTLALANRIGMAFLGSDQSEIKALEYAALCGGPVVMSDALDRVDRVCNHLREHSPGLRKVLTFSIGMSLENLRERTRLTDEDLKGLEKHIPGEIFWPAPHTVYEMWSTHTTVTDFLGRTSALYPDDLQSRYPKAIWRHELREMPGKGLAFLEVVLHDGCIKFWATGGRFGVGDPGLDFAAQDKYTFVNVPITEKELMSHLVKRGGYKDSISYYKYTSSDESLRWDLKVIDVNKDAASYVPSKRSRESSR